MTEPILAFLGAGNMGEALLRGLASSGYPAARLRAYDLDPTKPQAIAKTAGILACSSSDQALDGADWVILATKPQTLVPHLLPELQRTLKTGQRVLSIAAGVRLDTLARYLGADRPLVRVMPNTPGLIGQGVSAYCLGSAAGLEDAAFTERMLKPLGLTVKVQEQDMDAVTALSGSGPAYVFLFMEALQAAGEKLGLTPEATFALASQTITGAAAMIARKDKTPEQLRKAVTSPGGTTAAAIKVLEDAGFKDLMVQALVAAKDRSIEMGKG